MTCDDTCLQVELAWQAVEAAVQKLYTAAIDDFVRLKRNSSKYMPQVTSPGGRTLTLQCAVHHALDHEAWSPNVQCR